MKTIRILLFSFLAACIGYADPGEPYDAVPDIKKEDVGQVFEIPDEERPLVDFLTQMPTLVWNEGSTRPTSYEWKPIADYHASVRSLGHVRGRLLLEVRYISHERLAQAVDHADMILILAKGFDPSPGRSVCKPIYFAGGGPVYNYTSDYLPKGHKYGAVKVTRHYSGNGGHLGEAFLRGTEEFHYERFQPPTVRAKQDGGDQAAAVDKPNSEGKEESAPRSEGCPQ